jgi:hypothetical protein
MKISFVDFWGGMNMNKNFMTELLMNAFEKITVVNPEECEILFCGQFGKNHIHYNQKKKIFNELETWLEPDFNKYDYAIGFDTKEHGGRYVRIPCWMWYVDWFGSEDSYENFRVPIDYFFEENPFSKKEKDRFASFVFCNPVIDRINTIQQFNKYKAIDVFGNLGLPLHGGVGQKLDCISNYKFNFCYENTIRPGSFTEKLIHAKVAGCIPIYKSDLSFDMDFNKNCCIQTYGMNESEILEKVKELDNDQTIYRKIQSEPLFLQKPDLNIIVEKLKRILL